MASIRAFQMAWEDAQPAVFRVMFRVFLTASLFSASPFFALAVLFWLLDKPFWWWIAIPFGLGLMVVAGGMLAFMALRRRLRSMKRHLDRAAEYESTIVIDQPPQDPGP